MIDEHQNRILQNGGTINWNEKEKMELMKLFQQEKKRAECLDELSSEKNQDILGENLLLSDGEKQIDSLVEYKTGDTTYDKSFKNKNFINDTNFEINNNGNLRDKAIDELIPPEDLDM